MVKLCSWSYLFEFCMVVIMTWFTVTKYLCYKDHGYVKFVVVTISSSFSLSWFITWILIRFTWRVPVVDRELGFYFVGFLLLNLWVLVFCVTVFGSLFLSFLESPLRREHLCPWHINHFNTRRSWLSWQHTIKPFVCVSPTCKYRQPKRKI